MNKIQRKNAADSGISPKLFRILRLFYMQVYYYSKIRKITIGNFDNSFDWGIAAEIELENGENHFHWLDHKDDCFSILKWWIDGDATVITKVRKFQKELNMEKN
ncbi:hypothetical protein [[Mycoplasma] testudinis]|uniref:hypothetical protein n=1 Tax=[Mycoplasma] testudinis TaxID=33924 RepID=UPI000483A5B9|nr:hypothetical protein [[Mycoplasma] testudinis]